MSTGKPPPTPPFTGQAALRAAVLRRAADLAQGSAEHWETEAKKLTAGDCLAVLMAQHWRLIEQEFRDLATEPRT